MKGENAPARKFPSTGSRTHNHQVMSLTRSPLSHLGGPSELEMNGVLRPVNNSGHIGHSELGKTSEILLQRAFV